eukprot:gnl/Spiro4/29745_TR14612_c0_g1_i1.p2 gnl/Spiro4/29745_TR14612_c0_g1~~gnl/Spiro4/29745_TR14612_c0_g1_i1.p2  ORF type:complete len:465 (+),score=-0.22 gnl/Spiro4/29745_TR14612_c0_g1_i1:6301-7695(+)
MEVEKLDLDILKTIISNRKYGMEFSQDASEKLLHPDLWRFAKLVIDYLKIYKEVPTKRALIEKAGKNEAFLAYVEKIYSKIETIKYEEKEFKLDLERLKKRYQENAVVRLKALLKKDSDFAKNYTSIQSALVAIKEIDTQKVYAQHTLRDGIENFVDRFKARRENPDLAKGMYTGFTSLDFITNGLKSPSYVLCCGSSGSGKSTLLLSMAVNMFMQNNSIDNDKFHGEGNSVIYYSLEIPYEECFDKLISYISQIPLRAIETTNLTDEQKIRLDKTLKFIKNYEHEFLIVDIPKGATASQMEAIYSDFVERKNKSKVVVVDYLGIMECDDKEIDQDHLKQTAISEDLYKFCRVHDLILLTGVQLNETQQGKQDSQMGVFRLARAKAIINPSTLCLMLETKPEEQNYPTMNCHIIKNRRGPKGQFSLRKSFETCAFLNDTGFSEETQNDQDISLQLEKFEIENEE